MSDAAGEKGGWYVAIGDVQVGPLDDAELTARVRTGEIGPQTLSWCNGMVDWQPAEQVEALSFLFAPAAADGAGPAADAPAAPQTGPISWQPSAASALHALAEQEMRSAAADNTVTSLDPALPTLGAQDVFGGQIVAPVPPAEGTGPFHVSRWTTPSTTPRGSRRGVWIGVGLLALALGVAAGGFAWHLRLAKPVAAPLAVATPAPAAPTPMPAPAVPAAPTTQTSPPAPPAGVAPAAPVVPPAPPPPVAANRTPPGASGEDLEAGKGARAGKLHSSRLKGPPLTKVGRAAQSTGAMAARGGPSGAPKVTLDKNDVWAVVRSNASKMAPCLRAARRKGEFAAGSYTFRLDWVILPSGAVSEPQLKGPESMLASSLPACFASVLGQWHFPASQNALPIHNFPFGPVNVP